MKRMHPIIGCHLSISGGVSCAVERAREIGATAFQIFTSNPRGWQKTELAVDEIQEFRSSIAETKIYPVAHMPYLPNLAAPDKEIYRKSVEHLSIELERCEKLGIDYLVTHLGSHLGTGETEGRIRIVEAIRRALDAAESSATILLENTAGTRNSLGTTPNDLALIIDALDGDERVGVCIDTAHAFAAGYDWRDGGGSFFSEVKAAGLGSRIMVLHFNDSKVDHSGKADRHAHIGMGKIGVDGLSFVINHPLFKKLPIILESPVDDARGDKENLEAARALIR